MTTTRPRQDGAEIRRLRRAAGLRPVRFAAMVELNRTTLYGIENGHTRASIEACNRIAAALGVPVERILRDPGEGERG